MPLPYQWQYRIERWKNAVRGLFGGGHQQPRPKLCPACGSLVGISATRCHQCGTNLKFSLAAVSKGLSGVFGGRAPVTTVLLIVNILMFGVSWMATASAGLEFPASILMDPAIRDAPEPRAQASGPVLMSAQGRRAARSAPWTGAS